jgi:small subunit ribosomal protein S17
MPRRILEGKVISDKMDKTVTVLVERRTMHPIYKKYIRKSAKYAAHDENNVFQSGDVVAIQECRPISARKTWVVISDIEDVKKKRHVDVSVDTDAAVPVNTSAAPATKTATKATATKASATKTATTKTAAKKTTTKATKK